MTASTAISLPRDLATGLESKFFWWEPVGQEPRSDSRIIAQAMMFASFADVIMLENALGASQLVEVMFAAQPGWLDDRSWEFWRGRLTLATGRTIPDEPPRRSFNAETA